ncbi:MAG: DUF3575 domain-containing protein [Bacteroidota bacterium]
MRRFLFLLIFSLISTFGFSQEDPRSLESSNELKVNVLYLLGGFPEITYEKILDEESAVGISLGFSIDNDIAQNFIAIPYYRFYFGKKRAAGFFIEGNAAVFSEESNAYIGSNRTEDELGLGLGISLGGKFLNKKGWIGELVFGGGRNFINEDKINEAYPRFGITIGKRF